MNAIDVTIAGRGKLTNDVIKHMQWMGPVENAALEFSNPSLRYR